MAIAKPIFMAQTIKGIKVLMVIGRAIHLKATEKDVMTPISQAAIKGELLGCSNHNFSNTQGGL